MLEGILQRKNVAQKTKITIKGVVSVSLVALAVLLPQFVHAVAGSQGGMTWLPMYLPVLVAGCLLGSYWGLCIGVASPIVSFLITAAMGNPMPAVARLPFMIVELATFAFVSGLFGKKIYQTPWFAFVAVATAQIAGRAVFVASVALFQGVTSITVSVAIAQIQVGLVGIVAQAVLVLSLIHI